MELSASRALPPGRRPNTRRVAIVCARSARLTVRSVARRSSVHLFLSPRRDAPQEARAALNILTGSKLVVKRIASKETKNPRVPVDGDALVAEVRFQVFSRDQETREAPFQAPADRSRRRDALSFSRSKLASRRRAAFAAHDEILSPESMRLLLN